MRGGEPPRMEPVPMSAALVDVLLATYNGSKYLEAQLASILHPKAVFRSPMAHTPYPSAQAVQLILGTVVKVFEDFAYHRSYASEDGLSRAPLQSGQSLSPSSEIVSTPTNPRPLQHGHAGAM